MVSEVTKTFGTLGKKERNDLSSILKINRDYVDAADFNYFYQATVSDYIRAWDKNQDGIPERAEPGSRRGIPSYDERSASENAVAASDLIAIQAAAFDRTSRST